MVSDELLLAFFGNATSSLLGLDAEAVLTKLSSSTSSGLHFSLDDCRRCVLEKQVQILKETTESQSASISTDINANEVQDRLRRLQHEPNLSQELKIAMENMNDAARIAICKLILYTEEERFLLPEDSTSSRNLQDEGHLDRTKLMEYFALCQSALQLECVVKFIEGGGQSLFERESARSRIGDNENISKNREIRNESTAAMTMFPQSRLEYVQRLLAKSLGWDPVFITSELRRIFVEKNEDVDYKYYDDDVFNLFQGLVEEMADAIRTASVNVQSRQQTKTLSDLDKGGNTRVVSVQYSEFEMFPDGTKESNSAPGRLSTMDEQRLPENEQKRQLRLASDAAALQQTILRDLFNMEEHERNNTLKEAAETNRVFMERVMALPPGKERIDCLRDVDAVTSKKLAMHKIWTGMLQANGGQPPKMTQK